MKTKICPKCGKQYSSYSALSRTDNKTKICPDCRTKEAVDEYYRFSKKVDEAFGKERGQRSMTPEEVIAAKAYRDEAEAFYHTAKAFLKVDRKTNWETRIFLRRVRNTLKWMLVITGINVVICVIAYFYIKSLLEG